MSHFIAHTRVKVCPALSVAQVDAGELDLAFPLKLYQHPSLLVVL